MGRKTYSSHAPECPYCGHKQDHDGGLFYDEDMTECECERCEREFNMSVYTITTWTCTPKEPTP